MLHQTRSHIKCYLCERNVALGAEANSVATEGSLIVGTRGGARVTVTDLAFEAVLALAARSVHSGMHQIVPQHQRGATLDVGDEVHDLRNLHKQK